MAVDYEYKTRFQTNVNRNETINMGRKAPAVSKRIFKTLNDAQLYVDNPGDSAIAGLIVTVLSDYIYVEDENHRHYGEQDYIETRQNGDYSGAYRVIAIGNGVEAGMLERLSRGDAAWFKGNAVSADGSSAIVTGAKVGDVYMNTLTLDTYMLVQEGANRVWRLKGSLIVEKVSTYYKLSDDGTTHPAWDNTWTRSNADGSNIPHNYVEAFPNAAQVYLWSRFYDANVPGAEAKYTVSMVYSTLNLGTFSIS